MWAQAFTQFAVKNVFHSHHQDKHSSDHLDLKMNHFFHVYPFSTVSYKQILVLYPASYSVLFHPVLQYIKLKSQLSNLRILQVMSCAASTFSIPQLFVFCVWMPWSSISFGFLEFRDQLWFYPSATKTEHLKMAGTWPPLCPITQRVPGKIKGKSVCWGNMTSGF